jgi:hypothetical protein
VHQRLKIILHILFSMHFEHQQSLYRPSAGVKAPAQAAAGATKQARALTRDIKFLNQARSRRSRAARIARQQRAGQVNAAITTDSGTIT